MRQWANAAGSTDLARQPFYNRNNPAKQWIFAQIADRSAHQPIQVCDLACGDGSAWPAFLRDHPQVAYLGVDNDARAIARARRNFADCRNARVVVADGQRFREPAAAFDLVTALSSLEHVVRPRELVASALALLKPDGRVYLNYDAGHFRSHDLKERLMVPIGRALARFGYTRYYLREIRDDQLCQDIDDLGGRVTGIRKNNLDIIKVHLRDEVLNDEVCLLWHEFEAQLNRCLAPAQLSAILGATVVVVEHGQ